ncbi:uncharacterized protein EDB91DRAFT_1248515 [Suillus paluster]|uniref:uncharacterized protein n=1 Tax=Suillus paluster TaxID=48578 RepID=UPI001B87EF71|nr:uncharacterized protein EDB91DRAFT_1248515 [Suillus paluster]KAG1740194.1 hypothetical protein EDB91DRAFT_1248515 [Suillus paluster]
MSDIVLPVKYIIESVRWEGQLVSVGGQDGTSIVGLRHVMGGTQTWKVRNNPSTGMVTFQGVHPSPFPDEGKYIAVDKQACLLDEASWFRLIKAETGLDTFMVEDAEYHTGWHLHNNQDGCPVTVNNVLLPGGQWKLKPVS